MSDFRRIIETNRSAIALLVGNGIHRYRSDGVNSWDDLLANIARRCSADLETVPPGTSITEFYDVLELHSHKRTGALQAQFCEPMSGWRPFAHHRRIVRWAERHGAPILTTNFDEVLNKAADCSFLRPPDTGFSSYYPWECRFAHELLEDPCDGFGIWHINGMARYQRSIRLGLTHYMGSVHRARNWIHRNGEASLFAGKNQQRWIGANSWMHVIFNRPMLVFGLGLRENEVFLRWLLIERAKYFRRFEERRKRAWYVYTHDPEDLFEAGKLFFLKSVGFECVRADSHADIYTNEGWQA